MKKLLSFALIALLLLALVPTASAAETPKATLKITWNANGGKVGTAATVTTTITKGAKIGKLPKTPVYAGYTFKGWYTAKSGGTKVTTSTKPTKAATYYAQWTAKIYTLTYNTNGGSATPAPKKLATGAAYGTLPVITRSGYTLAGWFTAASGGAQVSATTKMAAKNVTIYAQWKAAPTGSIDPKLVGVWSSGKNTLGSIHDSVTGAYLGDAYNDEGIEFKADGTFTCYRTIVGGDANRVMESQSQHKGNYRVEGNTIYLTSVMLKLTVTVDGVVDKTQTHDYQPMADHRLIYHFDDFSPNMLHFEYPDDVPNRVQFAYVQDRIS